MQDDKAAPAAKPLAELKTAAREMAVPDQKIDMFSMRGFALAQRIAQAYATSDSVPAIYRSHNLKKDQKNGDQWVENTAAMGNCLVAIETAQAIGMSITAVMQNTNMIEGKQSWSGQFKIAAVNASKRFTVLRYDMKYPGKLKASYKEKDGWNKEKGKWNMIEHTVEIDNIVCIAWALPYGTPFPPNVNTLEQARAAGLPVIEGPPISMKLAVEEGWYAKPGSKWQTEMKHKMLPTRAGAYFSDIYASDIVMGMGRTTEELEDMATIDVEQQPDGRYAATNLDALRTGAAAEPAKERNKDAETVVMRESVDSDTGEVKAGAVPASFPEHKPKTEAELDAAATHGEISEEAQRAMRMVMRQILDAATIDALAEAADLIKTVPNAILRDELSTLYRERYAALEDGEQKPKADAPAATGPTKRARRTTTAPE